MFGEEINMKSLYASAIAPFLGIAALGLTGCTTTSQVKRSDVAPYVQSAYKGQTLSDLLAQEPQRAGPQVQGDLFGSNTYNSILVQTKDGVRQLTPISTQTRAEAQANSPFFTGLLPSVSTPVQTDLYRSTDMGTRTGISEIGILANEANGQYVARIHTQSLKPTPYTNGRGVISVDIIPVRELEAKGLTQNDVTAYASTQRYNLGGEALDTATKVAVAGAFGEKPFATAVGIGDTAVKIGRSLYPRSTDLSQLSIASSEPNVTRANIGELESLLAQGSSLPVKSQDGHYTVIFKGPVTTTGVPTQEMAQYGPTQTVTYKVGKQEVQAVRFSVIVPKPKTPIDVVALLGIGAAGAINHHVIDSKDCSLLNGGDNGDGGLGGGF